MIAWAGFDTAIGRCAIAWGGAGIVGSQLPEHDAEALERRMARRFPDAVQAPPPPAIQAVMGLVVALLDGAAADLAQVELDMRAVPRSMPACMPRRSSCGLARP